MNLERSLRVYINSQSVATLYENNSLWSLEYDPDWLNSGKAFPLSPSLPLQSNTIADSGTQRPVQWFFDNLLPEEMARQLLAKDLKLATDDVFGLLEAVGAESAGALTLLREGEELPPGKLGLLTTNELSQRIRDLPRVPLNLRTRKRMSLAGAQHKMLIILDGNTLYEPIGQMASTHILKPEHEQRDLYPFTVRNEHFTMSLARACGLEVPDVTVKYVPEACYIVERFDRRGRYPRQERMHVLDACQLLDLAAYRKYSQSTLETLVLLVELSRAKAVTALRLFRWVLFNFLVGNGDAHLKNLSFRYGRDGVVLLPHYDLLSTAIYERVGTHMHAELSQALGDAKRFGEVRREHMVFAAEALGLTAPIAEREIDRMTVTAERAALAFIDEIEDLPVYPGKAGELRTLRQILHLCIEEFGAQLKT